ncbi:MAG: DUF4118 domain-containing protein [Tepidisphaeraceae bacterium]
MPSPSAEPTRPTDGPTNPVIHAETLRPAWVDTAALYALACGWVAAAHFIGSVSWHTHGPATYTGFFVAVVLASLYGGVGPGLLATVLATVDLSFSFMEPFHSFSVNLDDTIFLIVFASMAGLISSLQGRRQAAEDLLRKVRTDLEKRVEDRTAALAKSEEKLQMLVHDLLNIAEREQTRIGHDLHDGIGQELTGISMLAVAMADRLHGHGSPVAAEADEISRLVRQSIAHTRDLARGLCPVDLEHDGIVPALSRLTELVSRLPNLTCSFSAAGDPHAESAVAIHLYRIAQEAINNALRHGRATAIDVAIYDRHGILVLSVADNGVGFSPILAPAGLGLRLMHYRARTIDADLTFVPRPGGGTVVLCSAKSARKQPP